jgi:uncharacterized membrane protein
MSYSPKKLVWFVSRIPLGLLSLVGWLIIQFGGLFYIVARGFVIVGAAIAVFGKNLDKLAWKLDKIFP